MSIHKDKAIITVHHSDQDHSYSDQDHSYSIELVDLGTNKSLNVKDGFNSAVF